MIVILSINRKLKNKEVIFIKLGIQSKKKEVIDFLNELHTVINSESFNIEKDFTLIKKKKKKEKEQFSTLYTLLDLDYDAIDVIERLKDLVIEDYSETLIDKDNIEPPLLFVFGKDINNRQIYIKLKMKEKQTKHVLCVSFHYAEEKMLFPYA